MTKETRPVEIPSSLRPVLLGMAKNLLHHLYGPPGPPWGTSFADLEELMVQLSDTLSSELLHQPLQRPAEQPLPEPLQHCPRCGRPTQARDPEPRCVPARIGTAQWQEPASHCDRC